MKPSTPRLRRRNIRPTVQPITTMDGWTEPTALEFDPPDYPWEGKI